MVDRSFQYVGTAHNKYGTANAIAKILNQMKSKAMCFVFSYMLNKELMGSKEIFNEIVM